MRTARFKRRVPVDVRPRRMQVRPEDVSPNGRMVGQALFLYQNSNDTPALYLKAANASWAPYLAQVVDANDALQWVMTNAGIAIAFSSSKWRHTGDADDRIRISNDGGFSMGDGTNTTDWAFSRTAANEATIATGDSLVAGGGNLRVDSGGFVQGTEISDPVAGAANTGRLYVKDNGAGKSQLVIRFNTGAVQVIATEP